ncbi:MAG: MFS transporter [Candidatus Eremiobacteraeota bacterium]|nr:MFS transporter [Candidatus Eremiobacteraeota bacterium]
MRALQLTIVAPSLWAIAHSLRAGIADLGWVIVAYATGSLIAQPLAGRLSDAKGRKRVFLGAIALFAVGSLICALSTSLGILIAGRTVQSLGAGAVAPAATAIIGDYVPDERQGGALGLIYGAFALAAVIGSVIGGVLVDAGLHVHMDFPWHLIFWINIPLALVTLGLGMALPADRAATARVGFDPGGIALIAAFAGCVMAAGAASPAMAGVWIAAAIGCILALAAWERRATQPIIDPVLLSRSGPALVFAIAFVSAIPIFSVTIYSAAYYIARFHANAAEAGIALLFLAIPLGIGQGGGGHLLNRFGAKAMLSTGIASLSAGLACLAALTDIWGVRAGLALCGLGMGLATAPPNVLIYRYVDAGKRGAATGLLTMFASSGAITAPALVTAILNRGTDAALQLRIEYAVALVLALACIPLATMLPAAAPPPEPRENGAAALSRPSTVSG